MREWEWEGLQAQGMLVLAERHMHNHIIYIDEYTTHTVDYC